MIPAVERAGKLHPYKRSAIDKLVTRVAKRVGYKFTNHTPRRTYGRMLWLAGVPIETIAEILGHADTKTTILYLGLNMDDQASAMTKLAEFQDKNRSPQNYRNLDEARKKSGQSGIHIPHHPDVSLSVLVTHTRRKENPFIFL